MAALAALGPAMTAISSAATIVGTAMSAMAARAQGKAAETSAKYEAQQLEMQGKEEQAAAQREAEQLRRQKTLALSQVQARSAASGFSATDPTTLQIASDIEKYGTLQQQMAQYGGESRRAGREAQAQAALMEGRAARQASKYKVASTIIGGIESLAGRFSGGGQGAGQASSSYRYG
jgi:hypothetical protein